MVSDRAFGGADTLATSYTLKCAIDKLEKINGAFDLVCGKQAIDGDTAQVGPEIAEHMDCPQITYAVEAKVAANRATITNLTAQDLPVDSARILLEGSGLLICWTGQGP